MKRLVSTLALAAVLSMGTTQTFAGVLVGGLAEEQTQCNQKTGVLVGGFTGVLVGGFTGVLVGGFTGVLVGGFANANTCDNELTGVLVGG